MQFFPFVCWDGVHTVSTSESVARRTPPYNIHHVRQRKQGKITTAGKESSKPQYPNNPIPRKNLLRFLNRANRFWFRLNVINAFPLTDELLGVVQVWSGNIRRTYDNQTTISNQSLLTGEPSPKPSVFSGRVSVGWSSTRPVIRSTTVEFLMALEVTVTVLLKLPQRLVL